MSATSERAEGATASVLAGGLVEQEDLRPGEAVANRSLSSLGRGGRIDVRVRVVGPYSLGWIEVAEGWGARVEAVVGGRGDKAEIARRFNYLSRLVVSEAFNLAPTTPWDGICLATVREEEDAKLLNGLLARWRPLIALVAYPGKLSRPELRPLLPPAARWKEDYHEMTFKIQHRAVGGVTQCSWHILHVTRHEELKTARRAALMTTPTYRRTLQTVLDDTAPCGSGVVFEARPSEDDAAIGYVVEGSGENEDRWPVYDGGGLAPDVSELLPPERLLWVRAQTVWRKEATVRRMLPHELLALWDYEGKQESKHWKQWEIAKVTQARLESPPAKIMRAVAYPAFGALLKRRPGLEGETQVPSKRARTVGKTADIPTSILEAKAGVGRAAATPDDAGIDLSIWAIPGETEEEAQARQGLRKMAAHAWGWLVERDAERWLKSHPSHSRQERAALDDCVRRARACSYWEWCRGSRIMWFRLPEEWQTWFREGPRMFRTGPLPKALTRNAPTPSRSAEIEVRKKIFKLNFRGYTEAGFVDLVQPRFPIVKTMVDGEVTDIRVVWNSRSNGYNDQIWAPGFCLPTCWTRKTWCASGSPSRLGSIWPTARPTTTIRWIARSSTSRSRATLMSARCF